MRSVATLTTMTSPTPSSKVGEDDAVLKGAFLGPDSLKWLAKRIRCRSSWDHTGTPHITPSCDFDIGVLWDGYS